MRTRSLIAAVATAMGGTSCVDTDSASGPKMGCAYNSWTETQYKGRRSSI